MNLDELKRRIAVEAERVASETPVENWRPVDSGGSPLTEEGEKMLHRRDFITVPADEFLQAAYQAVLGRSPDESGRLAYSADCATWIGRVAVLGHLGSSAEARRRGRRVAGTEPWRRLYPLLKRLPGGWAVTLADTMLRLLDLAALEEALTRSPLPQQLRTLAARCEETTTQCRRLQTALEESENRLHGLESQIGEIQQFQGIVENRLHGLEGQISEIQQLQGIVENRLAVLTETPERRESVTEREAIDRFYLAFENACRGEEATIRARLSHYLPLMSELPPGKVADLGCGRGEWLALLADKGIEAVGIDTSPAMLATCRQRGLTVTVADAVEWLSMQPEESLAAVTAFHLLEHLPFAALLKLVENAHRALKPRGAVIFETPNPENVLVGSHTFYHDPTHRNPLTPTLMTFVLEYAGFRQVRIERLHPYPDEARVPGDGTLVERINGHFYGPQDFAAIGRK